MRIASACVMLLLSLVIGGLPSISPADEPTAINAILADPDVYHLRVVTLQGTVHEVRPLDPYFLPSGTACYGAYTFLLEDEDGSFLEVAALGVCGVPLLRVPEVTEHEKIVLEAEIHAPGHSGFFRGLDGTPLFQPSESKIQVIAKRISRLGE